MANSCAGIGPSTSYPPRGLTPWGTWCKESRNVFFPHIPYRYAVEQNRGRASGMLHSWPALPSKIGNVFEAGTHTWTNREDGRNLKFLLTSRKLHQTSPTRGVSIWFSHTKNMKISTITAVNSKTFWIFAISLDFTILGITNIYPKQDLFEIPISQRFV